MFLYCFGFSMSLIVVITFVILRLKIYQYSVFKVQIHLICFNEMNGDGEIRTLDPLLARQVLSQLSYTPI